jgi:type 1 glutamine amidotransferase
MSESELLDALLFTRTVGKRHASLQPGIDAFESLARVEGWTVTHSEDGASFSTERLARHGVVILLNTTGDVLDPAQRESFESFVAQGGGVLAIHASAVIEFDWPWYESLIGARCAGHPEPQRGTLVVEDAEHPAMRGIPQRWSVHEQWYDFEHNPRGKVHVLASVDESSYEGGKRGDHPLIWCHEALGGRVLYSGLGHDSALYADPLFMDHVAAAVRWCARKA